MFGLFVNHRPLVLFSVLLKGLLCLLLLPIQFAFPASIEKLSEEQAKAALIYNFVKHTQWPNEEALASFRIGFYGKSSNFFPQFRAVAAKATVRGKPVEVVRVRDVKDARRLQAIVVASDSRTSLEDISSQLVKTGTLIISDNDANKNVVMINFTYPGVDHIGFEINRSNIVYEGLSISKEILLYGGTEIEVASLYKEMEFSLRKIKDEVVLQKQELAGRLKELERQNIAIKKQSVEIQTQVKQISVAKESLLQARQALTTKTQNLMAQEEQLHLVEMAFNENSDALAESRKRLSNREAEVENLEQRISTNIKILEQQQALIEQKNQKVEAQGETIESLRGFIVFALVLLLIGTIFIIIRQMQTLKRERKLLKAEEELVRVQAKSIEAYEVSLKIKNDFLVSINHELRTPMSGIIGAIEVANRDEIDSVLSSLELVNSSATDMMRLIEDILTYTDIQSDHVVAEPECSSISECSEALHKRYLPLCQEKLLTLHWQLGKAVPDWLMVDRAKLETVLCKLLDNAVKFTDSGTITFSIHYQQGRTNGYLVCSVEDTGVGIDEENQTSIFEAFRQHEGGLNRSFGGLGIGLAISKQLVLVMGGKLTLRSTPGSGSCFTVTLEVEECEAPAVGAAATITADNEHPVLVVEDNIVNQKIIQRMLSKLGYPSVLAENGEEALKVMDQREFSLVLMDLQMPVMDGITCTRKIRKRGDASCQIPIVAVTANLGDVNESSCVEAGMNGFIGKPLKLDRLRKAIGSLVRPCQGGA